MSSPLTTPHRRLTRLTVATVLAVGALLAGAPLAAQAATVTPATLTGNPGDVLTITVRAEKPLSITEGLVPGQGPVFFAQTNWTPSTPGSGGATIQSMTATNGATCGPTEFQSFDCTVAVPPGGRTEIPAGLTVTMTVKIDANATPGATLQASPAVGFSGYTDGRPEDLTLPNITVRAAAPVDAPALTVVGASTITDTNGDELDSAGDTVTYSAVVTNTGNTTLSGITIVSQPSGVELTCPARPVLPLATLDCTSSTAHTLTQSDVDSGRFSLALLAAGTSPAGATVTATNQVATDITQVPAMSLMTSATPARSVEKGAQVGYTTTVRNTGNVTLSNLQLSSTISAPVSCASTTALAPGAATTCTSTRTVTAADATAGTITNVIRATTTGPLGTVITADDRVTHAVTTTPAPPTTTPTPTATSTPPAAQAKATAARPTTTGQLASTGSDLGLAPLVAGLLVAAGAATALTAVKRRAHEH